MLSIEGLKVAYGHVEALRGIDLDMRPGRDHRDHRLERGGQDLRR